MVSNRQEALEQRKLKKTQWTAEQREKRWIKYEARVMYSSIQLLSKIYSFCKSSGPVDRKWSVISPQWIGDGKKKANVVEKNVWDTKSQMEQD